MGLSRLHALTIALLIASGAARAEPLSPSPAPAKPYVVEYYYKVKWGHLDEFLELYKRNHYPILQRLQKMGEILEMSAAQPMNHAGEGTRWDFRFTITYKDAAAAYEKHGDAPWVKELYPDQEKLKKEEQHRFELLLEHIDVPIQVDRLEKW